MSYCESFQHSHIISRNIPLKDARIGQSESQKSENVEHHTTLTVSHRRVSSKLLKAIDIKGMTVTLITVTRIPMNKRIKSRNKSILTRIISEVVSLKIMYKNKFFEFQYALQLPAFINILSSSKIGKST